MTEFYGTFHLFSDGVQHVGFQFQLRDCVVVVIGTKLIAKTGHGPRDAPAKRTEIKKIIIIIKFTLYF